MATLLDGTNEVLKRVAVIQGDTTVLSSLTSSSLQAYIDVAVQAWNEAVEELYSQTEEPMPKEMSSSTITLVADDRSYALATDMAHPHPYWPLHDDTNGNYIYEYPGDYLGLIRSQSTPANYTGLPVYGAINPSNGELYLDRLPTASEAGNVYTYEYDKDVSLSAASDTFPFSDQVYRALVPAVVQIWREARENSFNESAFTTAMGRAGRYLSGIKQRENYGPLRVNRSKYKVDYQNPFGDG